MTIALPEKDEMFSLRQLPPPARSAWNKYRRPASLALLILVGLALISQFRHSSPTYIDTHKSTFKSQAPFSHPSPNEAAAKVFWHRLANILHEAKPSFAEVRRTNDRSPWITYNRLDQPSVRPDLLDMSWDELKEFKTIHAKAIEDFKDLAPSMPFVKGTRGIVTTASNDALAILTSSLWMLRASGSMLPVEIWFEDEHNYEQVPCEVIFPSLGAKCMFMQDYLPKDLEHPLHIVKFTFKTLALLFSSYEQILFLDCDAFPVANPDSIFVTEPFVSAGWVMWPDYWASTASHFWYDISGLPEPDLKDRASVESGELLINKATHGAALLLVQLYNVWGPEHWHRLFSQAAPGEGDKDTFPAAVQVMNMSWYQVAENPQRIGYRCDKKHAIGSGQSHPNDDFLITSRGIMTHEEGLDLTQSIHPRVLFIHGNLPKYDPYILLDWRLPDLDWNDMLRCDDGDGRAHRFWGPKELAVAKYGWDPEAALWDALRWEACTHEQDYSIWVIGSIFRPTETLRHDLCPEITKLYKELFPMKEYTGQLPKPGRPERPWGGFGLESW